MIERNKKLLLLAGSSEGFAAAQYFRAVKQQGRVMASFAGRTARRRTTGLSERDGGFGGVEGLKKFLIEGDYGWVVDATHPFAAQMKRHADEAALSLGIPIVHWMRTPWLAGPQDKWIDCTTFKQAASSIPSTDKRILLAVGRQELHHFTHRSDLKFLARIIDLPEEEFNHPNFQFLQERGPFVLEQERILFDRHNIGGVICKNSGGKMAFAKIQVSRERGLPVVMIKQPPAPSAELIYSAEALSQWLRVNHFE